MHMNQENVRVTPAIAAQWLERNHNIRKASPPLVAKYARTMERGEWIESHPDPIMFDTEKRLRNGQHRLQALVDSGATLNLRVWHGCPEDIIANIDTGRPRALYETVTLHSNKLSARIISAVVTASISIKDGNWDNRFRPTADEALQFVKDWGTELDFILPRAVATSQLRRAVVVWAIMEYMRRKPEKGRQFAASLYQVDGEVQQARVLRDYLLRYTHASRPVMMKQYGYTVGACGYHAIGKPLIQCNKCYTWESMPTAEGN